MRDTNKLEESVAHPEICSAALGVESNLEGNLNFRRILLVPLLTILMLGLAFRAEAQSNPVPSDSTAPVIVSPDLTMKQEVLDSEQVFSFIFMDSDRVVTIKINGEKIEFQPAETVVINRKFRFKQGKSLLHIYAEDEKGNSTERSYLVGYGRKEREYLLESASETGADASAFKWNVDVKAGLELDSNPTNDMSSALEPLYGVVPEDNQADTRLTLDGIFSAEYGKYNAVGGVSAIQYSKSENDFLKTLMLFGGIGYKSYLSSGRSWMLDTMFTDIDTGGYDYAMILSVSPGIEFRSRGKRGEHRSLILGLDLLYKNFAIKTRKDGAQGTLKYDFWSLDETRHHLFRNLFAMGTSTEGTASSEYTFARLDFDWKNSWDYGLRWDFGVGIEHRTFASDTSLSPDTKLVSLGSKHIDIPFRLEMGLGWKFSDSLKAMFNTKYVFNLSNDVSYERLINGFTVSAVF